MSNTVSGQHVTYSRVDGFDAASQRAAVLNRDSCLAAGDQVTELFARLLLDLGHRVLGLRMEGLTAELDAQRASQ